MAHGRSCLLTLVTILTQTLAYTQSMAGGGASALIWPDTGEYVGSRQCALCHPSQARTFRSSSMSHALERIEDCQILQQNPRLTWTDGTYHYLIEKAGGRYRYSVTNGTETAEATLRYAFGQGKAGQTYVYQADGHYFESRVSYYRELRGLDLTVGAQNLKPENIAQALGRMMSPGEARDCFGCHTTAARRGNQLQLEKYEDGVQCEDCHGPGAAHIASIVHGKPKPGSIRSLKGLTAEGTNELCGSCHRTWETIMLLKIRGTPNVRFQPYRLTNSSCFLSGDRRIACTACHDPHAAPSNDARTYDPRCLSCHNAQNAAIAKKVCKVASASCVSCHMPRYEVPGSHHAFADHWIRVARSGDPYPD
jgi:hypothetical protein